jgi:hypothetical protein
VIRWSTYDIIFDLESTVIPLGGQPRAWVMRGYVFREVRPKKVLKKFSKNQLEILCCVILTKVNYYWINLLVVAGKS